MKHITLYRKWRPKTFDDVKGRDNIITILKNQITNNMLSHAYLFSGTRGTGKTSIAKIFAKAVNCSDNTHASPCGVCDSCISLENGSMDIVEIDAASNNGVDNIRSLISDTDYLPSSGKYKVYIIDEVHMLSSGAYNALLKTLEEPPQHVIFILATTEISKLPVTIVSRCQRFEFLPVSLEIIQKQIIDISLKENYFIEDSAANYLSVLADGSFRDALSILDMIMAFSDDNKITLDKVLKILNRDTFISYHNILNSVYESDLISINKNFDLLLAKGKSIETLILEFATYVKNIISVSISKYFIDTMTADEVSAIDEDAKKFSTERLFIIFNELTKLNEVIKKSDNKRMQLDLSIMKILVPQNSNDNVGIISRLDILEKEIEMLKTNPIKSRDKSIDELDKKVEINNDILNKYKIDNMESISTDIKIIAKKWHLIDWKKYKLSNFMSNRDKYSINLTKENNILILCHSEIFTHMFSKNIETIENILNIETGIKTKLIIEYIDVDKKRGIDLTDINFPIERE